MLAYVQLREIVWGRNRDGLSFIMKPAVPQDEISFALGGSSRSSEIRISIQGREGVSGREDDRPLLTNTK